MTQRKLYDFPGGLRLPAHKQRSTQRPIRKTPVSPLLILPLQQHIGEAARPIVKVGDRVLKGQRIAQANGDVSVCLHAPTSGVVRAIEIRPVPHPSGLSAPCIVIESDGEETWIDRHPVADYRQLTADVLRRKIRDAGIVGLGGAGFPSFIKLTPRSKVDLLLINGAECEPYISCDMMLMKERATEILDGIAIMQYALNATHVILAIEDDKPDALAAMAIALHQRALPFTLEIVAIPTRYPSGGEKQLIQSLTGQEVPAGGLPIDLGIVCHNPATAYAVGRAINHDEPLISRIVTVTGDDVPHAGNFETLLGTPIKDLLDFCNIQHETVKPPAKISHEAVKPLIQGGPMMGYPLASADLPITKTANCILVGVASTADTPTEMPCIRCGDCVDVCPSRLLPQQLYWYAKGRDFERTQDYKLFDCIECGCCDYVCPSKIPLVSYFRFAKTELKHQQHEQQQARQAQMRYEARLARLEREKLEKEQRQRQRKAALVANKKPSAVVQKPVGHRQTDPEQTP